MPKPYIHCATPLLIVSLLSACGRDAAPPAPLAQPVRVISQAPVSANLTIAATGMVRAAVESPLAFKTPGIIAELRVDAGQKVTAGQALAALVTSDLDAQLTQARENLAKTERDLARAESLRAKGMISQQSEQDVRAQREVARAGLAAAQFNRQQAVITAPAAGVILEKRADTRETVAAGQPVVILGRLDRGWVVRTGLPAREAVQIRVGNEVRVFLDISGKDVQPLSARVSRIGAASDPRTGTIEIEAALPKFEGQLLSGMVARLEFPGAPQEAPALVSLPLAAVLEGNAGSARVFVLDGDGTRVKRLEVRTGRLHDGTIEVLDGLPAGARIVSEGAGWLNDGDAVRVLP